jgi:ubiquinone/menaquinone biosynthesis C-methylase UbiE
MDTATVTSHESLLARRRPHVCPWWLAWGLVNPIRRWLNDPDAVLGDFVQPGDRVLEIGPGPGFYTVPLARRVGASGKVICVDVQQHMLDALARRAARHGLRDRVETYCCAGGNDWLNPVRESTDKAALFYVLHEAPNPRQMLAEVYAALRPGGKLLLVEPKGHCPQDLFAAELWAARQAGFTCASEPTWKYLTRFQAAQFVR